MTLKSFFRFIAVSLAFISFSTAAIAQQSQPQPLTGDPATACQVILCLSSGSRPGECNPPLAKYFSISLKYWSDTVTARRNFLQLCPAAQDTSSANMPALVDAMANGAGRCDAAALNQIIQIVQVEQCSGFGQDRSCLMVDTPVIVNQQPAYCTAYDTNSNTYMLGVNYVGDPLQGGHWVNASGQ